MEIITILTVGGTILIILSLLGIAFFILEKFKKNTQEATSFDNSILYIRVPKKRDEKHFELEAAPIAAEQLFASLHGLLKETPEIQEHVSFEIAANKKGVGFYCAVPKYLKDYVVNQIYAQYPEAQISEEEDYVEGVYSKKGNDAPLFAKCTYLTLAKSYIFPIKTFRDFEVDPLAAITSTVADIGEKEQIWIQYLLRPIPDVWQQEGYEYIRLLREGASRVTLSIKELLGSAVKEIFGILLSIPKSILFPSRGEPPPQKAPSGPPRLFPEQELELEAVNNKLSKMGFEVIIRIAVFGDNEDHIESHVRGLTASFRQFSTANLNGFMRSDSPGEIDEIISSFKKRVFYPDKAMILNTEELASVFHLPSSSVDTPNIRWAYARRGEPPGNLPFEGEDINFFAKTTFRDEMVKFGIKAEDRLRHMYVVGKSGVGKSTLFENMVIQDMQMGNGVCVLDPHGSMVDRLLDFVPKERVDDVVILDPSDSEHPPSLNMFEFSDPSQKNLMASGLLNVFKKHFGYSWGPRLEYLLNYSILTLLEVPGTTMLGITRLLADKNYQKYIVYKVKDPIVKEFWNKEYKEMKGNQSLISEALSPIQNKVGRFLSSSTIRNIVGQRHSTIRIDEIMNNGKIFFVNLAKGKIGEDNSNLLGSLIISRIQFMAMQREKFVERGEKVRPFYVFVDEFQNFASESFESILSEARKYCLGLHLTHQYTAQLPENIQDAIFGNVGTIVSFALGAPDAAVLAPEFAPVFDENDLISMERYHIYLKLLIDGMTSAPFSAITLPPPDNPTGVKEEVRRISREKYGNDIRKVEEKIKAWVARQFDLGMAIAEERRGEEPQGISSPSVKNVVGSGTDNSSGKMKEGFKGEVNVKKV